VSTVKSILKWIFALFFVVSGVMHFIATDFYVAIMPAYLPWHVELVYLSGVIEIVLGGNDAARRVGASCAAHRRVSRKPQHGDERHPAATGKPVRPAVAYRAVGALAAAARLHRVGMVVHAR
jgi:hypothetical protein